MDLQLHHPLLINPQVLVVLLHPKKHSVLIFLAYIIVEALY